MAQHTTGIASICLWGRIRGSPVFNEREGGAATTERPRGGRNRGATARVALLDDAVVGAPLVGAGRLAT